MLALVGLSTTRSETGVERLTALPEAPAVRWTGFLIRTCVDPDRSFGRVVCWATVVQSTRPYLPIGIITPLTPERTAVVRALKNAGVALEPILGTGDVPAGCVPTSLVRQVRDRSIEGVILNGWKERWKVSDPETLQLLRAIVAHGVRGGRAYSLSTSAARGLQLSERQTRRHLASRALPSTAVLLRDARIRSVRLRTNLGMPLLEAVVAAGWTSTKDYRNVVSRWTLAENEALGDHIRG